MTSYYRTEAFVFKKEDRFEADRTFSVFTKDFGRVEIIGRAIRKINSKLRSGIEIFSLSEVEFIQGKHKKTLTDTLLIEKFKNIYQIPEKFEIASRASNVIDNFIKGEELDEKVFNLIIDIFRKLNNSSSCQLVYFYFFWNFISALGHAPELSKCVACQKKLNSYSLYFSYNEGGIICEVCVSGKRGAIKINSDAIKVLRLILKKDWSILSRLKVEDKTKELLSDISESYYQYLLS